MDTVIKRSVEPLVVEEQKSVELIIKDDDETLVNFPETNLNLSSVKGYREKRKEIKYLKMKNEAINELKNSLKIFKKEELHLNHSVVLFCCQIVEDLFTSRQKGQIKKSVVIDVCKEYFEEKIEVVEMVIDLVFDKVVKSSFMRRNKNKIKSIGFFLLEKISPNLQTLSQSRLKAL
jgi:hypothetical protein